MLAKKHFPLCLMCIGGCLSYTLILYVALVVITSFQISTSAL